MPKTLPHLLVGAVLGGVTAAPAAALPPMLQAPACSDYIYGPVMTLQQDNGLVVNVFHQGNRFDGGGASVHGNGSPEVKGTSSGSRIDNNIIFTVKWANGFENTYTGKIGDDMVARGTTINNKGASNTWWSLGKYRCVQAAPAPAPVPIPPPPPAEPGVPATVTGDVHIYAQPGGVGEPYGEVQGGQAVRLLERKADNWCHISGPGVPGGSGWVWGDFIEG